MGSTGKIKGKELQRREKAASKQSKLYPKLASEIKDHLICKNRNYRNKSYMDMLDAEIMSGGRWRRGEKTRREKHLQKKHYERKKNKGELRTFQGKRFF